MLIWKRTRQSFQYTVNNVNSSRCLNLLRIVYQIQKYQVKNMALTIGKEVHNFHTMNSLPWVPETFCMQFLVLVNSIVTQMQCPETWVLFLWYHKPNSRFKKGPCSPKRLCALVFLFWNDSFVKCSVLIGFHFWRALRDDTKNDCQGD